MFDETRDKLNVIKDVELRRYVREGRDAKTSHESPRYNMLWYMMMMIFFGITK